MLKPFAHIGKDLITIEDMATGEVRGIRYSEFKATLIKGAQKATITDETDKPKNASLYKLEVVTDFDRHEFSDVWIAENDPNSDRGYNFRPKFLIN